MNRSINREFTKECREKTVCFFRCRLRFIFLFLILFSNYSFAGTDTTNVSQYALNDPRNPNCPCHKLQKQAEEEYARLNKVTTDIDNVGINNENKNNLNDVNPINKEQNNSSNSSLIQEVKKIKTGSGNSFYKTKRKRKSGWITKFKFRQLQKMKRIKKVHPNYSVCFKW